MMEAYLEEMVQERLHNVSDTLNYITQLQCHQTAGERHESFIG